MAKVVKLPPTPKSTKPKTTQLPPINVPKPKGGTNNGGYSWLSGK